MQSQTPGIPETRATIFPAGIALDGQFVPWNNIGSCRWNRFGPDTVVIAVNDGQSRGRRDVLIPKSHHTLVENTFRRFGKWDEPGVFDDVAFETRRNIGRSA